jgi:thiosulfate reductase cytochrome b subunit
MPAATAATDGAISISPSVGHRAWVRICHWAIAISFLTLAFTGIVILMAHPRLYWGEVGNDLLPALLEFPISNNHRPDDYGPATTFTEVPGAPISATRDYEEEFFNQNSWGRSLHFLAAWILVTTGLVYTLVGMGSGHVWRDLLPRTRELAPRALWRDFRNHLRPAVAAAGSGPPYGLLQKLTYSAVIFIALPLMLLTGLTMSPAVTAAWPFLLDLFGGYQSARTIHFFCFAALILFLVIHVAMVIATGFGRQLRAMILGS